MRKRVIVICGVLIVFIIGVIVMALLKTNEAEFNPADNVTMEIVEGTLTYGSNNCYHRFIWRR